MFMLRHRFTVFVASRNGFCYGMAAIDVSDN